MSEHYSHAPSEDGGGTTQCQILNEYSTIIAVGWAICSKKDTYSRARGRLISCGRARKSLSTMRNIITRAGDQKYVSGPVQIPPADGDMVDFIIGLWYR